MISSTLKISSILRNYQFLARIFAARKKSKVYLLCVNAFFLSAIAAILIGMFGAGYFSKSVIDFCGIIFGIQLLIVEAFVIVKFTLDDLELRIVKFLFSLLNSSIRSESVFLFQFIFGITQVSNIYIADFRPPRTIPHA